jgi:hypothetical protein
VRTRTCAIWPLRAATIVVPVAAAKRPCSKTWPEEVWRETTRVSEAGTTQSELAETTLVEAEDTAPGAEIGCGKGAPANASDNAPRARAGTAAHAHEGNGEVAPGALVMAVSVDEEMEEGFDIGDMMINCKNTNREYS